MFNVACLQVNSSFSPQKNINQIIKYAKIAAKSKIDLLCLPENVFCMPKNSQELTTVAERYEDSSVIARLKEVASENAMDILIGSLPVKETRLKKLKNRSIYISKDARVLGYYDKMHLFCAQLQGGEVYDEAKYYSPGKSPKVINSRFGKLGMTICFDLRFPYLYRYYAQRGVSFITVPSAFTYTTGRMHWHVLLRARAIETSCFIFAPAQCGSHESGRRTFGHSLIISPFGEIITEGSERGEELIIANIDAKLVMQARLMIPCLKDSRIDSNSRW